MRVYVATIPFSGLKIDATLDEGALNARLQEGVQGPQILFTAPPLVALLLTRTHGGVLVSGTVEGECRQDCATCAEGVVHPVRAKIEWLLQPAASVAGSGGEIDDPGVIVFEGEHVNLEEPLQEALILGITPFWHPARDESDRCTACGRDCRQSAWISAEEGAPRSQGTLGALLSTALNGKRGPGKRG
jgi:uncharacterized metal-binding protein YceD (DUF177 family)